MNRRETTKSVLPVRTNGIDDHTREALLFQMRTEGGSTVEPVDPGGPPRGRVDRPVALVRPQLDGETVTRLMDEVGRERSGDGRRGTRERRATLTGRAGRPTWMLVVAAALVLVVAAVALTVGRRRSPLGEADRLGGPPSPTTTGVPRVIPGGALGAPPRLPPVPGPDRLIPQLSGSPVTDPAVSGTTIAVVFTGDAISISGMADQTTSTRVIASVRASAPTVPVDTGGLVVASSTSPPVPAVLVVDLSMPTFSEASAVAPPGSSSRLGNVAGMLAALPETSVTVIGHPDDTDPRDHVLSLQRAATTASLLIDAGVSPTRVSTRASSESGVVSDAAWPTTTLAGRVEFVVSWQVAGGLSIDPGGLSSTTPRVTT